MGHCFQACIFYANNGQNLYSNCYGPECQLHLLGAKCVRYMAGIATTGLDVRPGAKLVVWIWFCPKHIPGVGPGNSKKICPFEIQCCLVDWNGINSIPVPSVEIDVATLLKPVGSLKKRYVRSKSNVATLLKPVGSLKKDMSVRNPMLLG